MKLAQYLSSERGRLRLLCRQIGAYESDMSRWARKQRPVPILWCIPIEEATGGQVTRKDLRPDDYAEIWTELAGEAA